VYGYTAICKRRGFTGKGSTDRFSCIVSGVQDSGVCRLDLTIYQ
jgi:hypothetical protein